MNVDQTIKMLEQTIQELKKLDPKMGVGGHVAYPSNGYIGDLDGEITKISVEVDQIEEGGKDVVILGVNFKHP